MSRVLGEFPEDNHDRENWKPVNADDLHTVDGIEEPENLIKVTRDNVTVKIIIKSLTALAYNAGKFPNTIKAMRIQGYEVSRAQLKSWSEGEYAEDYGRIRENFSKTSEAEMVRDIRDTIHQAAEGEQLAIEKAVEGLNKPISAKDASFAALNFARIKKENVDKLQTLLGRPTQIIEERTAEDAIKKLVAKRILKPMTSGDEDASGA